MKTLSLLILAAICLHAAPALADETPGERMFKDGRALMLQGRFDEACPKLEESQRLEPHVGTLLNVAACHERQGRVGSAWVEYQKALISARAEGQTERAQLAGDRIKAIEPRVPWLRISSTTDDLTIFLDGGRLEHVAWGQEMPIDPGPHAVTAERSGAKVFEERAELHEGEHRAVRIDLSALPVAPPLSAPEQERVIVDPKPGDAKPAETPSSPTKSANRWFIEPGLFLGLVGGTADIATVPGGSASCSPTCGSLRDASGVAVGLNVFGGYALTESLHLGGRFVVAPSLGSSGAGVYALGPELALKPVDAFTIGAWVFFGNASLKGNATAYSNAANAQGQTVHAEGDLHGGLGAGLELSLRLFTIGRGEVLATSTPLFIAGSNGTAACLPVGLAFRFQ